MVGIEVAQDECVPPVEKRKKRADVELVGWGAGRSWRNVDVDDDGWAIGEDDGDGLKFGVGVVGVEVLEIDVVVGDGVVDEEEKTTSTISGAIPANHGEAVEFGVT